MTLTVPEKYLLLAQHPEKGRLIVNGIQLQYGLIGAVLLEMTLEGRLDVSNDLLVLKPSKKSSDPIVIEVEAMIKSSTKPRKIKYWVNKLSRKSRKFKNEALQSLEKKKVIRIEYKKFLGIIPYKKTYLLNGRLHRDLISMLKRAVLNKKELTDELVVLLALIEASKMHKIFNVDREQLKKIKKELKVILEESPVAASIDKTIKQVQAAIFVTIIASSAATSGAGR